jgi:hypothetical protein
MGLLLAVALVRLQGRVSLTTEARSATAMHREIRLQFGTLSEEERYQLHQLRHADCGKPKDPGLVLLTREDANQVLRMNYIAEA